jgi:hypothetical protein
LTRSFAGVQYPGAYSSEFLNAVMVAPKIRMPWAGEMTLEVNLGVSVGSPGQRERRPVSPATPPARTLVSPIKISV